MVGRLRLVALLAICGLLGACGGTEAVDTASVKAERADLRQRLHDLRDLPAGFSVRPREGWRSPVRSHDADCRRVLAAASGHPPRRGLGPRVQVAFDGDKLGEYGGAAVAGYRDAYAYTAYDVVSRALDRCDSITAGRSGTRFAPAELPLAREDDLGDEAVARRLRGRLNGYPYEMHLVFVRDGDTLISVVHTGVGRADPRRTERLATAVTAKVAGGAE